MYLLFEIALDIFQYSLCDSTANTQEMRIQLHRGQSRI